MLKMKDKRQQLANKLAYDQGNPSSNPSPDPEPEPVLEILPQHSCPISIILLLFQCCKSTQKVAFEGISNIAQLMLLPRECVRVCVCVRLLFTKHYFAFIYSVKLLLRANAAYAQRVARDSPS